MTREERKLERTAAMRLGSAMMGAIGLFVRRYMGVQGGKENPAEELWMEEGFLGLSGEEELSTEGTEDRNPRFDEARFDRLRRTAEGSWESRSDIPSPSKEGEERSFKEEQGGTIFKEEQPAFSGRGGIGAEELSKAFERDARRYDGDFSLYE